MATLRLAGRHLKIQSRPSLSRHASSVASSGSSRLRTGIYTGLFLVSTGLFAAYYLDSRSAIHRYVITPVIRHVLDAETGHKLAVRVLASGLAPRDTQPDDERLKTELWGEELSNPVGLAAGFDKHGEAVDGLFNLGFSWVEIGSVTPKPQPGNPRPRLFHLIDDAAVINRYGFPSEGHAVVLARLRARMPSFFSPTTQVQHASLRPGALLAVNLGKNKSSSAESTEDFVQGVRTFGPYADVLVVNVSSPNTPGLSRAMQGSTLLQELLEGVTAARDELAVEGVARKPKLVLKIAPDLDQGEIADVAAAVWKNGVDGVIVSNTTVRRPASLSDPNKNEAGGLSGPPLKPYSLATLHTLRTLLPASIPIIGCGGITSGADALEYARAGAAAVQVYTSFGYDGVGACRRIKDEITEELKREGKTWAEVVSAAVGELSLKEEKVQEKGTIKQLTEEAQELMKLVDKLGEQKVTMPVVAVESSPATVAPAA
ncbi:uncharacterized protein LAESUDRAFT_667431 [Laetiporus sulphureus 93-53]|uniref:Dihydroorotate dehydrogenase (quinone), mitochondrial n=1 Tax=Laetiporus sulphureus 93-53 TaxID=1314785 RepID=A0A165AYA9_9APHY|nr:uncharacterized protein LAESUDRAFT_667431 [Laetiporus sulphureus 93-53]KZS99887.1 hypothetical protein LAESUDRAFT_667431 [Laetiporus sulphureus 93-53]